MTIGRIHIGKRPGIGQRAINIRTFTQDMYITKKGTTKTFTQDIHVSTANTKTFTTDMHIRSGVYTNTFTMDMILLKGKSFTMDMHILKLGTTKTFTQDMHIANRTTKTFAQDMHVSKANTKTFTMDMKLFRFDTPYTFTQDMHISTAKTKTFKQDLHIAIAGLTNTFTQDLHVVRTGITKSFTQDINIANVKAMNFTQDMILYKFPIYILNGYDLTNYIKQPDMTGLTKKLNKYTAPNQILNTIVDMGTDPLQYTFEVLFLKYPDYDNFLTLVNSDVRGTDDAPIIFYPGRDDVYHKVKAMSARPTFAFQGKEYKASVSLDLEDPYLYSVHTYEHNQQTVATTPGFITIPFVNEGSVNSPFEKVALTGRYIGGQHLTNITISVMDGNTIESTIPISNQLLSDELATLNVYGYITCTYSDSYSTTTKYNADKYSILGSVVCSGGKVRIPSGGNLKYYFAGPHPILYNSLLTTKLNTVSGSPEIWVSSDNVNWTTAVRSDQIVNNVTTDYYINGSEKTSEMYVLFTCPTGAVLDIYGISFTTIRDATYYAVPVIPAWQTRTMQIYGTGSAVSGIDCVFRARKWP